MNRAEFQRRSPVLIALLMSMILTACGGAQHRENGPVNLTFTLENRSESLRQYRGRNTLLVLMRTSEMVSQIYMSRLKQAYETLQQQCTVLVLTVEPTEAPFVDTYRDIEQLPFPLGVAASEVVVGESALGIVPKIPQTYFIDKSGTVRNAVSGVLEPEALRRAADRFFDR